MRSSVSDRPRVEVFSFSSSLITVTSDVSALSLEISQKFWSGFCEIFHDLCGLLIHQTDALASKYSALLPLFRYKTSCFQLLDCLSYCRAAGIAVMADIVANLFASAIIALQLRKTDGSMDVYFPQKGGTACVPPILLIGLPQSVRTCLCKSGPLRLFNLRNSSKVICKLRDQQILWNFMSSSQIRTISF